MIYTEEGLKETQEMVVEMEQAQNRHWREIKAFNEQQYSIMTQGLISQIRQLCEEIEEYLGIAPFRDPVPSSQVPEYA